METWDDLVGRVRSRFAIRGAGARHVWVEHDGARLKLQSVDRNGEVQLVVMTRIGDATDLAADLALELNGRLAVGTLYVERDALGLRRAEPLALCAATRVDALVTGMVAEAAKLRGWIAQLSLTSRRAALEMWAC